jgi:hypothetical protein
MSIITAVGHLFDDLTSKASRRRGPMRLMEEQELTDHPIPRRKRPSRNPSDYRGGLGETVLQFDLWADWSERTICDLTQERDMWRGKYEHLHKHATNLAVALAYAASLLRAAAGKIDGDERDNLVSFAQDARQVVCDFSTAHGGE